eukprot:s3598_g7.t1
MTGVLEVAAASAAIAVFARNKHEKERQEARKKLYKRFFHAELSEESPERATFAGSVAGVDANAAAAIRAIERYQKERRHRFMYLSSSAEHVGDTRTRVLEELKQWLLTMSMDTSRSAETVANRLDYCWQFLLRAPGFEAQNEISFLATLGEVRSLCPFPPSMEPAQLAQLESMCNAFYNARSEAERAQAHQTLLPLVQNPQCMPQLQFVLAHTSSPHALIFAATGLMKLITSHWTSVSDHQKEEMRSFLLDYLAKNGPDLYRSAPMGVSPVVRLLCRVIKLAWLEGPQHQMVTAKVDQFLQSSPLFKFACCCRSMLSVMRELWCCRVAALTPLLLLFCSPTVAENSEEAYFDALAIHLGKNASWAPSTPSMRGTRRGHCTESNLYNCMGNANCCDPAAKCFAKDAKVAVCKTQCTPGVHLDDPAQWQTPWSCDIVGSGRGGNAVSGQSESEGWCSTSYRGNCLNNPKCCDGSFTCFERDSDYGACLPSCRAGIHWQDPPQYRFPWSCRAVYPGNPSPPPPPPPSPSPSPGGGQCSASWSVNCKWKPVCCESGFQCYEKNGPPPSPSPSPGGGQCSASWSVNCKWKPVCCESGFQCYEKNGGYGACLPYCNPGIHASEPVQWRTPWSCRLLSPGGSPAPPPTPPPPPPPPSPSPSPGGGQCSASWSVNCKWKPVCCESGFQCYEKNGPPPTPPPPPPTWTPAPTPAPQCSASYSDNCLSKPTCCDPAMTCFMKDSAYGQCLPFCVPGIHWNDPPQYQTPWACTPVGGSGPSPSPPPPTTTAPPAPPPPPSPSPSPPTPSPTPAPGDPLEIPFAEQSLYSPSGADLLTFHMYRAQGHSSYPPLNVNTGNLAGIMWYIQNEVVSGAYGSGNKFGIERVRRFKVSMKATQPLMLGPQSCQTSSHARCKEVRHQFVDAEHGVNISSSAEIVRRHYGYNIGCNNLGSFPFPKYETYYPGAVWYSLPGPCPQMPYYSQTPRCEQLQPGGKCGSPTGSGDCTWSYEDEGEQIWLGDVYGASNMSMQQFWNNSNSTTANEFKIKIVRDLFEKKYGAELPNPPCDFNFQEFYQGQDPSTLLHWVLGLEIYTDLTTDMQPTIGPSMSRHRRTALSFRDTALPPIFTIAIQTLQQLSTGGINVPDKNDERRLSKQVLNLSCNCLSFDFMGTIPDDTSDEQGTVMVPHSWSMLRDDGIPKLFFDMYSRSHGGLVRLQEYFSYPMQCKLKKFRRSEQELQMTPREGS